MRLLVDNNLSWRLCRALREDGFEAVHVSDLGMASASDADILAAAVTQDRVIVTRDADFEALIAATGLTKPSVVHLRTRDARPQIEAAILSRHLPDLKADLVAGAVVTIEENAVRTLRLA